MFSASALRLCRATIGHSPCLSIVRGLEKPEKPPLGKLSTILASPSFKMDRAGNNLPTHKILALPPCATRDPGLWRQEQSGHNNVNKGDSDCDHSSNDSSSNDSSSYDSDDTSDDEREDLSRVNPAGHAAKLKAHETRMLQLLRSLQEAEGPPSYEIAVKVESSSRFVIEVSVGPPSRALDVERIKHLTALLGAYHLMDSDSDSDFYTANIDSANIDSIKNNNKSLNCSLLEDAVRNPHKYPGLTVRVSEDKENKDGASSWPPCTTRLSRDQQLEAILRSLLDKTKM